MQSAQPLKPYQHYRYWSAVPFRHGPDDIVKQCATPAPRNPAHQLQDHNSDALCHEFVRHLVEDDTMGSFDIGLQFLDIGGMTYWGKRRDARFWIENASVAWKESQAPFHTVARLTFLPGSQLSQHESDAVYFDVTSNAAPDSTPIGSINRARLAGELASRRARPGTNADAPKTSASLSGIRTLPFAFDGKAFHMTIAKFQHIALLIPAGPRTGARPATASPRAPNRRTPGSRASRHRARRAGNAESDQPTPRGCEVDELHRDYHL